MDNSTLTLQSVCPDLPLPCTVDSYGVSTPAPANRWNENCPIAILTTIEPPWTAPRPNSSLSYTLKVETASYKTRHHIPEYSNLETAKYHIYRGQKK
jgi:hypothetical protein